MKILKQKHCWIEIWLKNKFKLILNEERVDPLEVEGDGDVDDAVGVGNRDDQRHTN